MPTRKYEETFLFTLENLVIVPRKTVFLKQNLVLADGPSCSDLPMADIFNFYIPKALDKWSE